METPNPRARADNDSAEGTERDRRKVRARIGRQSAGRLPIMGYWREAGEVLLLAQEGGAAIRLKNDGSIELTGRVLVNGTPIESPGG